MTAGGLFGGILAGTIGQKVPVYKSYRLLILFYIYLLFNNIKSPILYQ